VLAEEKILGNDCLEAGWLEGLLDGNVDARFWKIKNSIKNHWDSLGDSTHMNVEKFAASVAEYLCTMELDKLVDVFRLINPEANKCEITKHVNAFNCSKDVEGYHLTTGHVLETVNSGTKEYWLCLSPACDLVPDQKESGWQKQLGENMAF
jgi:hypothetical protein